MSDSDSPTTRVEPGVSPAGAPPGRKADEMRPQVGLEHGAEPHRCLVVMYHYVREPGLPVHEGVPGPTPGEFAAQLDRLCGQAEPVDWPTLYAWMRGRGAIPKRCFLPTFDDGLADHARTVLPMLQQRSMRGVFFVPGVVLTDQRMLPAQAIHLLFSRLGEERFGRELEAELARHRHNRHSLRSVDPQAAEAMYHYEPPTRARLKYLLTMTLPIELRDAVVGTLFERHVGSSRRWSRHWYLSWDALAEMESLGHTIGGHGHLHEPYLRMTPAQRRDDMRRVARVLRDGLGADIRPFSYPYGSFDDDTATACRQSGFAHAFTTESRWVAWGCDPLRIPRVDTIHVSTALGEESECARV